MRLLPTPPLDEAQAPTTGPPTVLIRGADGERTLRMPLVGLGTWLATGAEADALASG